MINQIQGLILNEEKQIRYFIYNGRIMNSRVMTKQFQFAKDVFGGIDGLELRDGVLTVTKRFPKYRIEGLEKIDKIMNVFELNQELRKDLCGIDEEKVELHIFNHSLRITKSYRNPDFFTDYDYDSNGYNDAEFIGWDIIPCIVEKYLDGISKENISCGGGEKLWFSVEVHCNDFAKLIEVK